jgi:hypothetical protein
MRDRAQHHMLESAGIANRACYGYSKGWVTETFSVRGGADGVTCGVCTSIASEIARSVHAFGKAMAPRTVLADLLRFLDDLGGNNCHCSSGDPVLVMRAPGDTLSGSVICGDCGAFEGEPHVGPCVSDGLCTACEADRLLDALRDGPVTRLAAEHAAMRDALEELVAEFDTASARAAEQPGCLGLRETGGMALARTVLAGLAR